MGRKDKKKKEKKKKNKDKWQPPSEAAQEIKKESKTVIKREAAPEPKISPRPSETIEKWKRKLEQEHEMEKEILEESKLHEEIVLPKLKHREIKDEELITCPKCKQLTIVIEGKCSICNAEIKS